MKNAVTEKVGSKIGSLTQAAVVAILIGSGLIVGLAFFVLLNWNSTSQAIPQPPPILSQVSSQLLIQSQTYQRTAPSNKPSQLNQIKSVATQRKTMMLSLLQKDPDAFVAQAYTPSERAELPTEISGDVESTVDLEGLLATDHSDDFKQHIAKDSRHLITDGQQQYSLYFVAPLTTDDGPVKISGVQLDQSIAVTSISPSTTTTTAGPNPQNPTPGYTSTRKVAVVFMNFQNDPTNKPFTLTNTRNNIFTAATSTNAYYHEVSANLISLVGKNNNADGDIFDWVTVPFSPTSSADCQDYSINAWADAANSLIDAGLPDGTSLIKGYDNYIYIFPFLTRAICGWDGIATQGGAPTYSPRAFLNGNINSQYAAHELGHNFGFGHARSMSCMLGATRVTLSDICTADEYGDPFDDMGGGYRHFGNFRKEFFHWYDPTSMIDSTTSGTYTIQPMTPTSGGTKIIRIPRTYLNGTKVQDFYLEYRQPFGQFDNFLTTDPDVNGVTIRLAPDVMYNGATTELLDTTPATGTFNDSPLAAGQTFTSATDGVTITTNSVSPAGANITIALTCVHRNPSIIVGSPPLPIQPGKSITINGTAYDNDTNACPPTDFALASVVPTGWTMPSIPNITLTPNTPTPFSVIVTSPSTTTDGKFSIQLNLSSVSPVGYTSIAFTQATIDHTPPIVSITQPKTGSSLPASGTILISSTTTDTGPGGGLDASFSTNIIIDGVSVRHCIFSSCGYTWTLNPLKAGAHSISAQSTDAAGNIGQQTISVCYPFNADGSPFSCTGSSGGPRRTGP